MAVLNVVLSPVHSGCHMSPHLINGSGVSVLNRDVSRPLLLNGDVSQVRMEWRLVFREHSFITEIIYFLLNIPMRTLHNYRLITTQYISQYQNTTYTNHSHIFM